MKYAIASVVLVCVFLGCATYGNESTAAAKPERQVERGIRYSDPENAKQTLTIVKPISINVPIPALIFIHGGGFASGDPSDFMAEANIAADRGYAAVLVRYRLTYTNTDGIQNQFPAALHDVKAAVRWVRAHAIEYEIDPDRIGLIGFSSGANLALVAGASDPEDGMDGPDAPYEVSSRVQAVVAVAPTYVIPGPELENVAMMRNAYAQYLGGTRDEVPELYEAAGPVRYLGGGDPPILAIFGSQDPFASLYQAQAAVEALEDSGEGHLVIVIPGSSHDFERLASPGHDYPMWSFLRIAFNGD